MISTKKTICTFLVTIMLLETTSCGYFLYPERRGQRGGQIDPAVAIMDGLGLLLWIIPGVVAFAVDFTNGTIYYGGGKRLTADGDPAILTAHFSQNDTTAFRELEEHLSNTTGTPISLDDPRAIHYQLRQGQDPVAMVRIANAQISSQ